MGNSKVPDQRMHQKYGGITVGESVPAFDTFSQTNSKKLHKTVSTWHQQSPKIDPGGAQEPDFSGFIEGLKSLRFSMGAQIQQKPWASPRDAVHSKDGATHDSCPPPRNTF